MATRRVKTCSASSAVRDEPVKTTARCLLPPRGRLWSERRKEPRRRGRGESGRRSLAAGGAGDGRVRVANQGRPFEGLSVVSPRDSSFPRNLPRGPAACHAEGASSAPPAAGWEPPAAPRGRAFGRHRGRSPDPRGSVAEPLKHAAEAKKPGRRPAWQCPGRAKVWGQAGGRRRLRGGEGWPWVKGFLPGVMKGP